MTGTTLYEVRRVSGVREMQDLLALRHQVFCQEQGVPEHGDQDMIATYLTSAPRSTA